MTDNELNATIAEKVMGLKNVRAMYGQTVYDMIHTYTMDNKGQETITYQPAHIPDYANDIAVAWQVVERVGAGWIIYNNRGTVEIYDSIYNLDEGQAIESDASPARAICLAALEAVGVEVE